MPGRNPENPPNTRPISPAANSSLARKQPSPPRSLDLNDTVSGMLKMLQRLIGESIQLVFLPAPGLWPMKSIPAKSTRSCHLTVNAPDAIDAVGK